MGRRKKVVLEEEVVLEDLSNTRLRTVAKKLNEAHEAYKKTTPGTQEYLKAKTIYLHLADVYSIKYKKYLRRKPEDLLL